MIVYAFFRDQKRKKVIPHTPTQYYFFEEAVPPLFNPSPLLTMKNYNFTPKILLDSPHQTFLVCKNFPKLNLHTVKLKESFLEF